MIGLFAALVLFAQAAPLAEPTVGVAPAEPPKTDLPLKPETKAKGAQDKVVCHDESVAGSHFRRKVCQTKATEATRAREDQEQFRRARDQNQIKIHD